MFFIGIIWHLTNTRDYRYRNSPITICCTATSSRGIVSKRPESFERPADYFSCPHAVWSFQTRHRAYKQTTSLLSVNHLKFWHFSIIAILSGPSPSASVPAKRSYSPVVTSRLSVLWLRTGAALQFQSRCALLATFPRQHPQQQHSFSIWQYTAPIITGIALVANVLQCRYVLSHEVPTPRRSAAKTLLQQGLPNQSHKETTCTVD